MKENKIKTNKQTNKNRNRKPCITRAFTITGVREVPMLNKSNNMFSQLGRDTYYRGKLVKLKKAYWGWVSIIERMSGKVSPMRCHL